MASIYKKFGVNVVRIPLRFYCENCHADMRRVVKEEYTLNSFNKKTTHEENRASIMEKLLNYRVYCKKCKHEHLVSELIRRKNAKLKSKK